MKHIFHIMGVRVTVNREEKQYTPLRDRLQGGHKMNSLERSENGLPANGCWRSETGEKQVKRRDEIKKAQDLDCLRRYPVDTRFHLNI